MMEVINGKTGKVWARKDEEDVGQKAIWVEKYNIKPFPTYLARYTSAKFLFSPNFKYQLDYIYKDNQFIIRRPEYEAENKDNPDMKQPYRIDAGLINFKKADTEGGSRTAVAIYASRIHFVTDDLLKIVSHHNLECLF